LTERLDRAETASEALAGAHQAADTASARVAEQSAAADELYDQLASRKGTTAVAGAIAYARSQLGDAYRFAGAGPDAWDCSGLPNAAYASVGTYIGTHSATNQYNALKRAGRSAGRPTP
jgi:cell wall-associated NlpC family hydrolase